jgi:hypothetical protein
MVYIWTPRRRSCSPQEVDRDRVVALPVTKVLDNIGVGNREPGALPLPVADRYQRPQHRHTPSCDTESSPGCGEVVVRSRTSTVPPDVRSKQPGRAWRFRSGGFARGAEPTSDCGREAVLTIDRHRETKIRPASRLLSA